MVSVSTIVGLTLAVGLGIAAEPDPLGIVRKAVELNRRSLGLGLDYHMTQDVTERELDDNGKPTVTKRKTFEVFNLFGEPYSRLVARDGQPLSAGDAAREQRKYEETKRSRERETAEQRRKRVSEYEQKLSKRTELLEEIPAAFSFRHVGVERLNGLEAWVLDAEPNPNYKPPSMRASFLPKFHGRFWISREHNRLMKVDAVSTGPLSFGWFLAKLGAGTKIDFEQVLVEDSVWMMKRFKISYDARIALVKRIRAETEQVMSNFRKVDTAQLASAMR